MRDLVERGGRLSTAARREPKARHGRQEERRLWALFDPELTAYLGWPHAQQICRLERRRVLLRQGRAVKVEREVTYLITSAGPERADPAVRSPWLPLREPPDEIALVQPIQLLSGYVCQVLEWAHVFNSGGEAPTRPGVMALRRSGSY